jgi:5-methylthioadenosine/S-adenosylhomocysteine deaminase
MQLVLGPATIVTMDLVRSIIHDGAIVMDGDRIAWIGPFSILPAQYSEFERIDARGKVVFPGFVDLHNHSALSVLRGIADNIGIAAAYSPNVPQGVYLSEEESSLFSLLGVVLALQYGTTCLVDNYINSDLVARACQKIGIRAVISERLHDADLFRIPSGEYDFSLERGMRLLEKNIKLIETWQHANNNLIRCRIGPHAPDTCSGEFLKEIRKAHEQTNADLVIHLAQSRREVDQIQNREKCSPVVYLERMGLLGPKMIAGHCVFVNREDIEILHRTHTPISHQSVCNAKNAITAPIKAYRGLGMTVGLGSDNKASDMIEVMRTALIASRIREKDQNALKAGDVLEMATICGAQAAGWQDEIGSLEVGKKADIVLVDYRKVHMLPVMDEVANLVHCGMGSDVTDVWVNGKWLVRDGVLQGFDMEGLLREVQKAAEGLWLRMPGGGEICFTPEQSRHLFS